MAPSALEKYILERDAFADALEYADMKIKANAEESLTDVAITNLILKVTESRIKLDDIHMRVISLNPADKATHRTDHFCLLDSAQSIENALHGLRAKLPIVKTEATTRPSNQEIRLPKLELKSFDGNLLEWISFRDLFVSSVHDNKSLSKIQKMTYLQTLLKGEASKQIQSMILSDANYDIAWKQLHDRYQNDREIHFTVMKRLLNQQPLQPSPTALRSLVDTTRECLRSLEILNLKADKSAESIILYVVTTKMDPTSRELWEQALKGTAIPPLQDLFEFLEQRARALAAGGTVSVQKTRPKSDDHHRRVHVHHGQQSGSCSLCNESNHPLYMCKKFISLTVSEKYDVLKKHNMFFNCLAPGHPTKKCQNIGRCKHCKSKHHSLLHKNTDQNPLPSSSTNAPLLSHHVKEATTKMHGMLATALIMVHGIGGKKHLCRALMDGGSIVSFISSNCLKRLGLRKTRNSSEVVGLATCPVGTAHGETSFSFSSHFNSKITYSTSALVLPKVTEDLPTHLCDPSLWSHLRGLTLADPEFHKPQTVDILIGSDVFWSLLEGEPDLDLSDHLLLLDHL